jgi:hypothetical protein
MPRTLERPASDRLAPKAQATRRVSPSIVDPAVAEPFTLDQEFAPFGAWAGSPIWVPPKDASAMLAETMLRETGPFTSKSQRWQAVLKKHRSDFTQVRELDLFQASIRLPKGKFFVTVTEQKNFDKITDTVPACVRTRLEEFLAGPGKAWGTKVYYLKPLCVEVGDDLILTTQEDLMAAVQKVQDEVFASYRRIAPLRRTQQGLAAVANACLALPRALVKYSVDKKQKVITELQNHLEFQRRKEALEAAKTHRQLRTDGCTFDDILNLTTPVKRKDVIEHYCNEQELSNSQRANLLAIAEGALPWFVALTLTASYITSVAMAATVTLAPPVVVCDPAFVAEMPGSPGVLLKIGHFDEVAGVTHIEL